MLSSTPFFASDIKKFTKFRVFFVKEFVPVIQKSFENIVAITGILESYKMSFM
jgi:hypothetical protein